MFQMLQTVRQFSGMPTEDPHLHLRSFLEVSDSFKLQGVSEEALRLKLFPFSLRDRARSWLNTLPPDSVTNWNDLAEIFLRKYFPPTRNAKFRSEIMSFQQLEDESTSDARERFKELLRKCPHHAFEILERITSNNYQWSNTRAPTSRKVAGVLEVDALMALTAQMASMTNILKNMSLGGNIQPAAAIQNAEISCVYCGDGHTFENCPSNPALVCYVGNQNFNRNNNPYSNSYNPAWSDTENPRRDGKEHCKAINLRSGKNLEVNEEKTKGSKEPTSIQTEGETSKKPTSSAAEFSQVDTASGQHSAAEKTLHKPPPPFPQRFKKQQQDGQFRRFLDVLKQLHINIPLVEALEQMPNYVKFLKDILTKKRRLGEFETVALTEGCSAMLKQNSS
ncbi:uncharacterized protein LOC133825591 [Humulus lupulus]|uniref:uncharacterized protein LOC133825591 n=1 Tax=Humulus lupulus TaxID=3486 RepID=UPI002B40E850|nr:uncharacterized protein LOC133825591 [Humulus lupulus]